MSIGAIDTSRIEAMVAQLRAAATQTAPASSAAQAPQATQAGGFQGAAARNWATMASLVCWLRIAIASGVWLGL